MTPEERIPYDKIYNQKNRRRKSDQANASYYRLKISDPKKYMLRGIKQKAKERGLEFRITTDDFEIPEFCPVLGLRLEFATGRPKDNSPSIDRHDSELGYVPDNIVVMSHLANRFKSNMTKEDIGKLYKYVFETQK